MTKELYRQAQRVKPCGEEGLARLRQIVAEKQSNKVNECTVDLFSASAIVKVYDALNETNRAKLLTFPVAHVAHVCMSLLT
jgi:hypothetical protein